jgi:hypothetical protein
MGMNFAKDAAKNSAAQDGLDLPERIRDVFTRTVDTWIKVTVYTNKEIFSGNDLSLQMLSNLLKDGNSLIRMPLNVVEVTKHVEKLLYSMLILSTWRMQGYSPVLVDTGRQCDDMGVGTKDWTTPNDLLHLARICIGDRQYHMLATQGSYGCSTVPAAGPGTPGHINCNKFLKVPPGLKEIRVNENIADWGGLNIYTMIDR